MGDNKCSFYQGYVEGSQYSGFMVKDQVFFGKDHLDSASGFEIALGCASKETNLFYDQKADGILGLGMGKANSVSEQSPIYEVMYD